MIYYKKWHEPAINLVELTELSLTFTLPFSTQFFMLIRNCSISGLVKSPPAPPPRGGGSVVALCVYKLLKSIPSFCALDTSNNPTPTHPSNNKQLLEDKTDTLCLLMPSYKIIPPVSSHDNLSLGKSPKGSSLLPTITTWDSGLR